MSAKKWLLAALLVLVAPLPPEARAQPPAKGHQVGCLMLGPLASWTSRTDALRTGLRDLGYVEGKNLTMVVRSAETIDRLPEAAAELTRLKVDVIFATSSTETEVARRATATIPIVFATHADPVGVGHVVSLAHPGGRITGLSMVLTEIVTKQLEIMKLALPHVTRVGLLLSLSAPSHRPAADAVETAAQKLGVWILRMPVRTAADLDRAFATMTQERVNGFLFVSSALGRVERTRLAELSLKHRLGGMFGNTENVEAGGLMSYAPDFVDQTRRAASYIDKILKGARPGDLPVEQASRYELVINLKTAKALGITIPPSVLVRADRLIE